MKRFAEQAEIVDEVACAIADAVGKAKHHGRVPGLSADNAALIQIAERDLRSILARFPNVEEGS